MRKQEPFTVVHRDDDIIVLNKAPGLLVAADRWDPDAPRLDLLASAALVAEGQRLYACHRIDKDTSGLVLYALNEDAHRAISVSFERRLVSKTYHALVHGRPSWDETEVDLALRADGDPRHRTVVDRRKGKDSRTLFRYIGPAGPYSWIEARPITGRTHQIRAHLQAIGLSIACDPLYGTGEPLLLSKVKRSWRGDEFEERPLLDRLALHARRMELAHPRTGEPLVLIAPYPKDLDATRKQLAKLFTTDPLAGEGDREE